MGSVFENISVDSVFNKNLPKSTRAVLNATYSGAGTIGMVVFTVVGGQIYDRYGPKAPFVAMLTLDFIYATFIMIISCLGIFNQHDANMAAVRLKEMVKQ